MNSDQVKQALLDLLNADTEKGRTWFFPSKDNSQQYLVTAPIHQVFNGTKNDFEINQIIQIKNQQITQRTTIQLGEE